MNKKSIAITSTMILLILICIGAFYYIQKRTYTLDVPNVEDIKSVVLTCDSIKEEISEKETLEDIVDVLKGTGRTTKKESTQDAPVDKENLLMLEFQLRDKNNSTTYLYKKNNNVYLEQPYNGIYQISADEYTSIKKLIK